MKKNAFVKKKSQKVDFGKVKVSFYDLCTCAITLNYCTYTNHVGVSPRALYYVVDTSYGLGTSLGRCRPALLKGRKVESTNWLKHKLRATLGGQ